MAAHPRSDGRWTHRRRVLALIASGHYGEVRHMLAVWYDRQGVNPGDTKKRRGWSGSAMPFPRVIPHSDGAGVIVGR